MAKLTEVARQARITTHRDKVLTKLGYRIIDVSKPAFADLYADGNPAKKMESLNGAVILERDLYPDGRLKGVVSVDVPDLAALLPDIKMDTTNVMGWKKHVDKFIAEGVTNLFDGVPDPQPSEYEV